MDDGQMLASQDRLAEPGPPWLHDVLSTVAEFHEASLGLVAWELCLPVEEVAPAWHHARSHGLLGPTLPDEESGEQMYEVTELGRTRAAVL